MAMPDACCTQGKPQFGDYQGKGTVKQIDDFRVYEVGSGSKIVLVAFDIFGFEMANTINFCDLLVEEEEGRDIRVIMPDYFRGKPFPPEKFPPPNWQVLIDYLNENAGAQVIERVTEATLRHYNVERCFILGLCWGARPAFQYAGDPRCCGILSIHGSRLEAADAERAKVPCFFVRASNDPPLDSLKDVLDKKPFAAQCEYRSYETMLHGWCAGRGDWTKPEIRKAAVEVNKLSKQFINKIY